MKKIFKHLLHILKNPSGLFYGLLRRYGKNISKLITKSAFYLQGQMDMHSQSLWYKKEFIEKTGGYFPKNEIENEIKKRELTNLEPWDTTRRDMLTLFVRTIIEHDIPGDFVEVGVYKGSTAKLFHKYAPERKLHLFDTFAGFKERSVSAEQNSTGLSISKDHFADTSVEAVTEYIQPNSNVFFYPAYFPDRLPENFDTLKFALIHLDADLHEPTLKGLEIFYPKISPGGMIIVHDYNSWIGAREAVDTFFKDKVEVPIPMPDKSGSVLIVKQ